MSRTIDEILAKVSPTNALPSIAAPVYARNWSQSDICAGLSVASMNRHMSDEGWQLFKGLRSAGYILYGNRIQAGLDSDQIDVHERDVHRILRDESFGTLVLQDKREWDPSHNQLAFQDEHYQNVALLKDKLSTFKLTIVKDAHQDPRYHAISAREIGCHAWITPYHPRIINHLATYTRVQHLIRTYHTIDATKIPAYSPGGRSGCLLSGHADGYYYPLRRAIWDIAKDLPEVATLGHPGYHNRGTNTTEYLKLLSRFKIAICTSSIFGYALRKIIEATACGCIVITDLPTDDKLPLIDENLIRVDLEPRETLVPRLSGILTNFYRTYDPERQKYFAERAIDFYRYEAIGKRLASLIQAAKENY